MKFAGLITAAGVSRRMNGFKPLMELNGFPMVVMTVQSMRNAGIRDITVVTGYRGQEVCAALANMNVSIVRNEEYASTDMLTSVKLGLRRLGGADGVFFLPADVPLTSPAVFQKMTGKLSQLKDGCQALLPFVGEEISEELQPVKRIASPGGHTNGKEPFFSVRRQTHPPLILRTGWQDVLAYEGERGLGGALEGLTSEKVIVDPEEVSDDADYRPEFELLAEKAKARRGVSKSVCGKLYEEVSLPAHIRAHCLAVGDLAGWMAEKLTEYGAFLDVELCRSGGYLHDLLRLQPRHPEAARDFLEKRGYLALAKVVREHSGFEGMLAAGPVSISQEPAIVCLADKLIRETERVTLEQRYQKAFAHENVNPRILRDLQICRRLSEEFEAITGEKL